MSLLEQITPLILTFNEAPNIRRTLEKLAWAKQILVMDSFSTDETLEIIKSFPQVHALQRRFDQHATQWNFGVDQVETSWILALDADYILPENFVAELESLHLGSEWSAYYGRFRYCIYGRPLRGTLYPSRAVLLRKDRCRYIQDGHTQRLQINGQTSSLRSVIDHDDRKSLSRWLWAQDLYAALEATKLSGASPHKLSLPDKLRRKMIVAPFLVFFYTLLGKGLIWDGWAGWYYVLQRTFAEILLSLRLIEQKLNSRL
jgi:glycosyltransferase involved in cell wall biosynthesis